MSEFVDTKDVSGNIPKRILLIASDSRHEEYIAAVPVLPGELLIRNAANNVSPHSVEGGIAERMYALEDALQGRTIDDAYAAGELVAVGVCNPGDKILARLDAGANVVIGDHLESAGNGKLTKATGSNTVLAIAEQAIDNTGSEAVVVYIPVRLL